MRPTRSRSPISTRSRPAQSPPTFPISGCCDACSSAVSSTAIKVVVPAGGSLKLVELAPNVQQVVGGTANNLIVAMSDGLVIFDAPCCETQSRWVIDAAKAKYPGKPIKYVVLTHHHMDHTGGARAYVAEGATVVVPDTAHAYFAKNLAQPRTVVADAQQTQHKPVQVVGVSDQLSLKDDGVEIRLHKIANPHVDGMLIGHVVQPNVVWVTDIWSPGRDAAKNAGRDCRERGGQEARHHGCDLRGRARQQRQTVGPRRHHGVELSAKERVEQRVVA